VDLLADPQEGLVDLLEGLVDLLADPQEGLVDLLVE
jgi:hypothetical protein